MRARKVVIAYYWLLGTPNAEDTYIQLKRKHAHIKYFKNIVCVADMTLIQLKNFQREGL